MDARLGISKKLLETISTVRHTVGDLYSNKMP